MSRIDIDGLTVNVEVAGDGPPLVLLHGFTGSSRTWDPLVTALGGRYTTIAIDLVGHGATDSPAALERYRMRRAVDDLAVAVRACGFQRAAWLGYSFGGRVALQVAVHRPDVVSALVLEGASPGLEDPAERAGRVRSDEALAERVEREGVEAFIDYWESIPLWDSQRETMTEEQRRALRQQRTAQDATGLANSLRGMGTGAQEPLHDRIAEIDVPVLLLAGTLDVKFTTIAREMAQKITGATMRQIDSAGHAAHLERPDDFHAAVIDFLRATTASHREG